MDQPNRPVEALLFETLQSFVAGYSLIAAAELGLADAFSGDGRSPDEVARAINADGASVHRLLRMLAVSGIVSEPEPGRFGLTPSGKALQGGRPGSLRPGVLLLSELLLPALAGLGHSVRTGEPAFEQAFGAPLYDYLTAHPAKDELFSQAMRAIGGATGGIVDAYDFGGVRTLVDVGGGQGWRTIEILRVHSDVQAILFDRPNVIERARTVLSDAGVGGRCRLVGGSFLESVPEGGDCYLLSGVVANWDDAAVLTILGHCRRAMPEDGRLVIFEPVHSVGDEAPLAATIDLIMLAVLGGRVRTDAEHAKLLEAAGFRPARVDRPGSPFGVIEARPI
jgi:O-methyltransferase domain